MLYETYLEPSMHTQFRFHPNHTLIAILLETPHTLQKAQRS
jgi:hypothetical protein